MYINSTIILLWHRFFIIYILLLICNLKTIKLSFRLINNLNYSFSSKIDKNAVGKRAMER